MGNLFAKHKVPRRAITDTDKAVLQLKTQRRQLTAQKTRVEGLIAREIAVAKELIVAKKHERALLALRKKRLREGQLELIDAYLLNVEQVLANIEAAQRQNRLYDALKQGTVALQALQKEVSLEDVEALREDTAAAGEAERHVRELLAESLSAEDDAAALQELAALEDAEEAAEAARLPAVPARPTAAATQEEAAPAAHALEREAIAELAEPAQKREAAIAPAKPPTQRAAKRGRALAVEEPLAA
ncbi:hypothetical protein WJX81_002322 [Elliptochloris bilobata]|uniref:Charged multivesicular body protein 6 n=1 Tax=Elliptochloris bilobata TaxID=381761 RepID=A0AAW1RI76_9CHLO